MRMADDSIAVDDVSEIVTKFLLNTYRLQPTGHDIVAVLRSAVFSTAHNIDDAETNYIPLISGSSAELYIKPMLSCVDDIDIMLHRSTRLAIPAGNPAPTGLPAEFHSRVEVYEIIDSQYPGYVYLKTRYLLTESNDDNRYNAVLDDRRAYVAYTHTESRGEIHGPAWSLSGDVYNPPSDRVQCVRCLSWPTQAADWPTRHRNHTWPDSATVDCVANNGCDVVEVAHRLCRQDAFESQAQRRLSFSRAEVVLLNSWTPVQQIVYHMLRVFTKISGLRNITDSSGTKILSNYHIKTLMLWACEEKPRCWWNSNTNVVRICVELLHTLAVWLTQTRCKHYFISNCNLMDTVLNAEIIAINAQLKSVNESWLSTWFVKNYILRCAELCPVNVSWLFDYVRTSAEMQTAVSVVVDWRRYAALEDLCDVRGIVEYQVSVYAIDWCQTIQTCVALLAMSARHGMQCSDYITAIGFLHAMQEFTKYDFNFESMDVLSILCRQFIGRRRYSSQPGSVLLLSQAVKLMKAAANNSRSTVQLIEIELSKAYLYRALRCTDSDNGSIYCLANVYLTVLYYTTGQYQTTIDHCTMVTRSQDHSQCRSRVVQGELLPKIDDNIDNVLGLAVFYQYVRTAALNQQQQTQHVTVFNTELFAHYLLIKCPSATKYCQTLSTGEVQRSYRKNVTTRHEQCTADILLCKSMAKKLNYHYKSLIYQRQSSTVNPTELNTSKLVELLQQSAVEHLITYRQLQVRAFGSISTIVTTDFEAMYAYKRGDYHLCLQLSTQNVHTLLNACRASDICTCPELIQLLDDDIVSLTALTLVVNSKCRYDRDNVGITQLTLSLYLMTRCQLKLRHSATQLTQTLGYIQDAQRRHPPNLTLNHLMLKLANRKVILQLQLISALCTAESS